MGCREDAECMFKGRDPVWPCVGEVSCLLPIHFPDPDDHDYVCDEHWSWYYDGHPPAKKRDA